MLTGCIPRHPEVEWNVDLPSFEKWPEKANYPKVPTIFEVAKKAGYSTALAATPMWTGSRTDSYRGDGCVAFSAGAVHHDGSGQTVAPGCPVDAAASRVRFSCSAVAP